MAKAILTYYSLPKQAGLLGNIFDSTLTEKTQPYNNYTFRIDQNVSERNRMFVRGSWYDRNSIYNDYTGTAYTGVNFLFKSQQGVIDDVHTFNATTVLNVRYGYNRFIRGQDQELDARGFDLTQLGFPASYNNLIPADIRRFPRFDFPANTILGNGMSNEFRPVGSHSFSATVNKSLDKHSVKFGSELRIYREDDSVQQQRPDGAVHLRQHLHAPEQRHQYRHERVAGVRLVPARLSDDAQHRAPRGLLRVFKDVGLLRARRLSGQQQADAQPRLAL